LKMAVVIDLLPYASDAGCLLRTPSSVTRRRPVLLLRCNPLSHLRPKRRSFAAIPLIALKTT
jgi:hypothetical protein